MTFLEQTDYFNRVSEQYKAQVNKAKIMIASMPDSDVKKEFIKIQRSIGKHLEDNNEAGLINEMAKVNKIMNTVV